MVILGVSKAVWRVRCCQIKSVKWLKNTLNTTIIVRRAKTGTKEKISLFKCWNLRPLANLIDAWVSLEKDNHMLHGLIGLLMAFSHLVLTGKLLLAIYCMRYYICWLLSASDMHLHVKLILFFVSTCDVYVMHCQHFLLESDCLWMKNQCFSLYVYKKNARYKVINCWIINSHGCTCISIYLF